MNRNRVQLHQRSIAAAAQAGTRHLKLCGLAGIALAAIEGRAQNPAEVLELPQVTVVGTTPLPGSDVPLTKVPANVQIITSPQLREQRQTNVTEFLEQNTGAITVNAAQGNPYQPDVNFRGFTASPLLGTPQGISVFVDGVRVNDLFGDTVNWDLIPQSAISSIQLIPGSSPAFGLNTLGGAIGVYTKSGASEYPNKPGGSITVLGGSFGRRALSFETGGRHENWDWFITGNDAADRGWADHNPSRVRQLFGKLGWQDAVTDLDLTVSLANNRLAGTQTLPLSFGDNIRQAYTYPDLNTNQYGQIALKGSRALSEDWLLSGNTYLRRLRNQNFSSNVNEEADEPGASPATNDRSLVAQTSYGLGLQLLNLGKIAGLSNKLSFGASIDQGSARFTRAGQDATFTPDRGTLPLDDFMPDTDADTRTRYLGVFASDSLDLNRYWTLTLAGRLNRADVRIADRSGEAPELDGRHNFTRFNPAIGLNFNPTDALTFYGGYNEGMRAPTAIELTCADPNAPCKLPNNFLADPPLKKVVSKTFEFGARGKIDTRTSWNAAIFQTELHDDLQFVSSTGIAANSGYFQNVGKTRRRGLELGGNTVFGPLALALNYSFLDATYRTGFSHNSPANSTADEDGTIVVRSGDRIPSLPRHSIKLRAEVHPTAAWRIGANLQVASSIFSRGDENNRDVNGRIPGWAVVHLDTRLRINRNVELFARINNVFDRRYANFGVLGENYFTGPGRGFDGNNPRAEAFRGYGVPRGAWVGVQYTFD